MSAKARRSGDKVVFLFDVDNTLLNNDQVTVDLQNHLAPEVGDLGARRYWAIFEKLRAELGYADYLGALQRYRIEYPARPAPADRFAFFDQLPFRQPPFSQFARRHRNRPKPGARRSC